MAPVDLEEDGNEVVGLLILFPLEFGGTTRWSLKERISETKRWSRGRVEI
jgi:hypothetical protein